MSGSKLSDKALCRHEGVKIGPAGGKEHDVSALGSAFTVQCLAGPQIIIIIIIISAGSALHLEMSPPHVQSRKGLNCRRPETGAEGVRWWEGRSALHLYSFLSRFSLGRMAFGSDVVVFQKMKVTLQRCKTPELMFRSVLFFCIFFPSFQLLILHPSLTVACFNH